MAFINSGGSGSGSALTTYRKVTPKVVNTTIGETDLLNGEITVASAALGNTGVLVGKLWGDWKQNSGGAANGPELKAKFGATTVFDVQIAASILTISNAVQRFGWQFDWVINNANANNSQKHSIAGWISYISSSATTAIAQTVITGEGNHGAVNQNAVAAIEYLDLYNTSAIDTSAPVAVTFTTTNGSASANYEVTLQGALFVVF